MEKRIKVRIMDEKNGLRVLDDVSAVRIRSKEYVLLIMADYLPAIGKIEGDVIFLTAAGEVPYRKIEGFYKHQRNEFTLLITSQQTE